MRNSEINNQFENYKIYRKLTRDPLISFNMKHLSVKPFNVSGTLSEQSIYWKYCDTQ
jgi:hypothetical protein